MEQFHITPPSSLWTIAWPPHGYKGPCLLSPPARRHSRIRVQLMASARHVIDRRDASLLSNGHARAYNHMTNPLERPIHFKPDSNHLAKWIDPNRFQTALAQCAFSLNARCVYTAPKIEPHSNCRRPPDQLSPRTCGPRTSCPPDS